MERLDNADWQTVASDIGLPYRCGFCDREVSSALGYAYRDPRTMVNHLTIRVCPHCNRPSYFEDARSFPSPGYGSVVRHLPADVEPIWREARDATAAGCPTAAVLLLRKLLMHLAVELGADEGKNFLGYVDYLQEQHVVPPQANDWIGEVRKQGNDQNHAIKVATSIDAFELMRFMEYVLKGVYELPGDLKARQIEMPPPAE